MCHFAPVSIIFDLTSRQPTSQIIMRAFVSFVTQRFSHERFHIVESMVESASAIDATGPKDVLERDISYLLNRADLQKHHEAFIRSGIVKVKHFIGADRESEVVGLSKMEAELLGRTFGEIQAESQQQALDSTGKCAF